MGIVTRLLSPPANIEIRTSQELAEAVRGPRRSWAGMDLSAKSANSMSAWFAGNRNIAEDIGKLPFILYRSGEARERATSSPFWRIVHDRVSTRWTSQQFREYMTFWASQDGDAFALKNIVEGQVRELLPFKRGEVSLEETEDGELVYRVANLGILTRREVFHLQGFAMNRESGANMFALSKEDIALALAMERHGATFFGNGAQPGGALTHPSELSDTAYERLQTSIHEDFTGANAGSPLLLEEGMSWQQFSVNNEQSQFLEGRKFQVVESARRVRIPPHKISDLERATFSNIEHSAIEYVVDTLLPWALRWENAINQQVIGTNSVYAELLFDMLLRGDSQTRSAVYAQAIQNGWMTPNEARRRENLPPLEGGDVLFSQLNLATPRDRELEQLRKQAEAAERLVRTGWDPDDVAETCGLPRMRYIGPPAAAESGAREPASATA